MSPKLRAALVFATIAHGEQERKYTGEPYIVHPIEVMMILKGAQVANEDMLCAALLHDVVEDTDYELGRIEEVFGPAVTLLVEELTEPLRLGNRAERKRAEVERIAQISVEAKTIKLADLISNSRSILERDPGFAKVYLREKVALLRVLTDGNPRLWNEASKLIPDEYWGLE